MYAYLQTAQDAAAARTLPLVGPLAVRIPNAGAGNAAPPSAGFRRIRGRSGCTGVGGASATGAGATGRAGGSGRASPWSVSTRRGAAGWVMRWHVSHMTVPASSSNQACERGGSLLAHSLHLARDRSTRADDGERADPVGRERRQRGGHER